MFGTIGSIFCVALDKHGFLDIVAATRVSVEIFQQVITAVWSTPEMVVWVDDALSRVDNIFAH
jgi:hypothetical protein